jgi:hypothetical protein
MQMFLALTANFVISPFAQPFVKEKQKEVNFIYMGSCTYCSLKFINLALSHVRMAIVTLNIFHKNQK